MYLWKPARISPKQKEEQAEDSSPDPSSSACDIRIQKRGISRSFAESFPQKIVSAKLRPHCFRFPRQDCFQKRFEFCTMNTAGVYTRSRDRSLSVSLGFLGVQIRRRKSAWGKDSNF